MMDQLSKMWIVRNIPTYESWNIIGTLLRFSHVKNPGMAFGISVGEYGIILTILSLSATIFIGYMHWQERNNNPITVIGLGLILGGAVGNMIDRAQIFFSERYEGVVDFIDIGILEYRWYIFNLADTAVTIGAILYLLNSLFITKPDIVEQND